MQFLERNLKEHYFGDNMDEFVILVDEHDNPLGKEEKVKCHLPNGKLHRAFTAMIFNKEGKLLLTKRSASKMLWPDDWDGTVASHPREGETYISSAERRMPEEIGITCKMNYVNKFEYHVPYRNIGSENEVCGTLIGVVDNFDESSLVLDEISEIKWITPDELKAEFEKNRDSYCPWMAIALYFFADCDDTTLEKFDTLIKSWTTNELQQVYQNAIKHYIPNDNWRLVK